MALSAAVGSRDPGSLSDALRRAKEEAEPRAVDEILLQGHLFVGFPIALNAIALWRELSGSLPDPASEESEAEWEERGERVCEAVYATSYRALRDRVAALHPDLDRWMVTGGYGRVIGRPAVDLVTRELCIVALLAVWDVPVQLHSHLRGALNAGATPAEVDAALAIAARYVDDDAAARNRDLWSAILARRATDDRRLPADS
jgi:4-carboxymuconolactone decarboxylase